ncbi:Peptidoglycan-recognition protein SC2 [Frankliniella fusca]|uniref:Peptidoglycan-recognition protein SC2 n=1 Tax=Frankliniella fusca TaxID=407009 RepID=A0AAE1H1J8_9NEOP|nr:Peptidoglycan-recognition protein SC2 [Frankliniella fusca]
MDTREDARAAVARTDRDWRPDVHDPRRFSALTKKQAVVDRAVFTSAAGLGGPPGLVLSPASLVARRLASPWASPTSSTVALTTRAGLTGFTRRRAVLLAACVLVAASTVAALLAVILIAGAGGQPGPGEGGDETVREDLGGVHLMSRDDWLARAPKAKATEMVTPVAYVIVHHTTLDLCLTKAECILQAKRIQDMHMDAATFRFFDIGYNFLVGGDGLVFEGRGWDAVGAHTKGWNMKAMGVAVMGTFTNRTAPAALQTALLDLLQLGVERGKLVANHAVLGACQVRATESPGRSLMRDLRTWPRWANVTTVSTAFCEA